MHLNAIQLLISFFFCTETQQCLKTDKTLRKVTVFMRNNSIIKMNLSWNFLTLFKTKRGKREQDRESERIGRLGREELWPWVPGHRRCCNAALLTVEMGSTSQLRFLFSLSPPTPSPQHKCNTDVFLRLSFSDLEDPVQKSTLLP